MIWCMLSLLLPVVLMGQREHKKAGVEICGSTVGHPNHGKERHDK